MRAREQVAEAMLTCIVGLAQDGKVWIGGDSVSASGWQVRSMRHSKVFRVQEFLIGYTSSFRMGQILEHHLSVPAQDGQCDVKYLVTQFIPSVRDCFKEHWFDKIKDEDAKGGEFLLGYHGHLYHVDCDFQVAEYEDGFDACGCGEAYALAAMKALETLQPKDRVLRALEIAGHFSGGVSEPFFILSV